MKEALFYERLDSKIRCKLCPRECVIPPDQVGFCRVRQNKNGKLVSLVYGKPCSVAIDPIEKKPLFHFAPGTSCVSFSTVGCNLDCKFCQNWEISHPDRVFGEDVPPEKMIDLVKEHELPGIAYTYTEPTIFYEYALDIMKLAKKNGLYNVWVSNGYINPEPAKKIAKYLDAINVDLKGDPRFYRDLCGISSEEPVKNALKIYKKSGVWIEITNLVIPGYNDRDEQLRLVAEWVVKNLGKDTPYHISRFFPQFKLTNVEPTPLNTLERAARIAEDAGLRYVYIGNVYMHPKESTYCPKCGSVMIKRAGYHIEYIRLECENCGEKIPIAGKKWLTT
ncbi:MAG: AmmeMemoRadiSam system radical SAM enzyme [Thermoplasmata archaeon]|nr:MAG: AmmeMemoRadiSam system radical SAM enzyme [Thermoplasmata archaeon]